MPTPIVMPSFGMYTAEGTLVNWLIPDGARVKQGESILEIETEKAVNPVIAPADGILSQQAKIGTLIKEQGLLGYILVEGEVVPPSGDGNPSKSTGETTVGPQDSSGSTAPATSGRTKASPAAKKLAAELGIDLSSVKATGPGGRIVEADVRAAMTSTARSAPVSGVQPPAGRMVPLSGMRRTIGERLRQSLDRAVSLTITREVEAGALVDARKILSERLKMPVPYDALFVKLLGLALREHSSLNAIVEDNGIRLLDSVGVCFAVAVPNGLVVPVVHEADQAALPDIIGRINRLSELARTNSLRSEDLAGGSSTVTNLGAYGVDMFTPILNPPQPTILGVGRIAERPVARQGTLSLARTCWLSLTFDHRLTDGVPAALFLEAIAKRMADRDGLCSLA